MRHYDDFLIACGAAIGGAAATAIAVFIDPAYAALAPMAGIACMLLAAVRSRNWPPS